MKRLAPLFLAALAAGALPLTAVAQQQSAPKKDAPRPPVLEKLEEGEPAVTIKPQGGTEITERREQGKLKEAKVKSGKSSYTVKPNEQPGSFQPGEGGASGAKAAQWQIMEFDLGAKKKGDKKDAADAAPLPPPPAQK